MHGTPPQFSTIVFLFVSFSSSLSDGVSSVGGGAPSGGGGVSSVGGSVPSVGATTAGGAVK